MWCNLKLHHQLQWVTKIHSALKFCQVALMADPLYIRMNTRLHSKSTTAFGNDVFKLMNNSAFGRTTKNYGLRIQVNLVQTQDSD